MLISPIIEWTDEDVWNFLNTLGIEHCRLYDEGFHRIGCICCPMSPYAAKVKECERYPHVYSNWIKTIEYLQSQGKYTDLSAQEIFDYWISGKSKDKWQAARKQQSLNFKD